MYLSCKNVFIRKTIDIFVEKIIISGCRAVANSVKSCTRHFVLNCGYLQRWCFTWVAKENWNKLSIQNDCSWSDQTELVGTGLTVPTVQQHPEHFDAAWWMDSALWRALLDPRAGRNEGWFACLIFILILNLLVALCMVGLKNTAPLFKSSYIYILT